MQIKKVKSHVKAVVLSAHLDNGKRFVLALSIGRSYSSEVKLTSERYFLCFFLTTSDES
jgi:hypothetical protein